MISFLEYFRKKKEVKMHKNLVSTTKKWKNPKRGRQRKKPGTSQCQQQNGYQSRKSLEDPTDSESDCECPVCGQHFGEKSVHGFSVLTVKTGMMLSVPLWILKNFQSITFVKIASNVFFCVRVKPIPCVTLILNLVPECRQ